MACPSTSEQHIPTLYDETHRGIWHSSLQVRSMDESPSLIAYLEHHHPNTDGSFAVCIASGKGNFISQKVYNSIPDEHRPQMEATNKQVTILLGKRAKALGQVFVPILLTNAMNGERSRVVLQAYVLEKMSMRMFLAIRRGLEKPFVRRMDGSTSAILGTVMPGKETLLCSRGYDVNDPQQTLRHAAGHGRTVDVTANCNPGMPPSFAHS